jgi:hypothetical protein
VGGGKLDFFLYQVYLLCSELFCRLQGVMERFILMRGADGMLNARKSSGGDA